MDVADRAIGLKNILKKWEKAFQETHDRKPSRSDVKGAPQRIQDAYREYSNLKKTPEGASGPVVTGNQPDKIPRGTWGTHLNQSWVKIPDKETKTSKSHEQGTILRQYSRKLQNVAGAGKLPKTPCYKKPGFGSHASKPSSKVNDALQAEDLGDDSISKDDAVQPSSGSIFSCLRGSKVSLTSSSQKARLCRDDIPFGVLHSKPSKKHSLKMEWLDSCELTIRTGEMNKTTEDCPGMPQGGVNNCSKTTLENQENIWDCEVSRNGSQKLEGRSKPPANTHALASDSSLETAAYKGYSVGSALLSKAIQGRQAHADPCSVSRTDSVVRFEMNRSDNQACKQSFCSRAVTNVPRKNNPDEAIPRERKASFVEVAMETGEHKTFHSSATCGKPASDISPLVNATNPKRSENQAHKTPKETSQDPEKSCLTEESNTVSNLCPKESQRSLTPNREKQTSVSGKNSSDRYIKESPGQSGSLQAAHHPGTQEGEEYVFREEQRYYDQLEVHAHSELDGTSKGEKSARFKKMASSDSRAPSSSAPAPKRSNLNENFVKLEMKKKRYSRRGLFHLKGEAYKRQVWKQKMQGHSSLGLRGRGGWRGGGRGGVGRGRGRGGFNPANPTDKCFKCGQTGHWASRCMGFQPDTGDDKKVEVKEEDFPTLEEAAMAARGIKTTQDGGVDPVHVDFIPEANIETMYDFPPPPPPIQPLLQLTSNGKPGEIPPSVYKALRQMGYSSFRPGQEQAVMRVLSGLSTLVVLSTGAGKSLIYQLASLVYSQRSPCITLVISPLVSLMDDQVLGLPDCLKGVRLHSNMTKPQREKVVKEIQAGRVNILLVSPEAIVGGGGGTGGGCMPALAQLPPIAFACIDEVHCLSEWSHNFRPSYLMLCKVLRDRLGVQCMLGLTATATMATAQSVAQHLGIADDPDAIIRGTCLPDNLLLSSSRDDNRERALVELLKSERFCHLPSIIIYCIRREDTERVASLLRTCLPDTELQPVPMQENDEQTVNKFKDGQMNISVMQMADSEQVSADRANDQCADTTKSPNGTVSDDGKWNRLEEGLTEESDRRKYLAETAFEDAHINKSLNEDQELQNNDSANHDIAKKRGRKKKTAPTQEGDRENGRIPRKGRKRKRLVSETDDEYCFEDEESSDVSTAKKRRTKTGKSTKTKVRSLKKKARITALKGVKVVTGVNSVEAYHAGMTAAARRRVQTAFMTGRLRIVVATVAFGMGLDKSDVRAVLHFNLPKSFESYVQEIGRAGRDQKPAHCHVFLEPQGKDLCELRRHTYANTVDRYCIKKLISKLFPPCKCQQARRLYQMSDKDGDTSNNIALSCGEAVEDREITDEQAMAAMEEYENSLPDSETQPCRSSRQPFGKRLCRGHLVAVPIDVTVQELDIKEEGISTLLCYLELHPQRWLVTLPPTYATCTIQCYGGPAQLQQIAKACPPVAVAIAKSKQRGKSYRHASSVEFDVVEVARCMGWDLTIVKKELRQLRWRQVLGKGWIKSGVMVEFSNLAFLSLSPGDLTDDEQDELVHYLTSKSSSQERRELDQLRAVHSALHSISHSNYWDCSDAVDLERSNSLKSILKNYFAKPLRDYIAEAWNNDTADGSHTDQSELDAAKVGRARGNVRQFLGLHTDRSFSGRAVARIFHGIASPCYPAQVWGRDRRFWRAHLDVDFNLLLQIATEEILRLR